MKKLHKTYLTGLAASVSMAAMLAGAPANAQDADDCERDANGDCVVDADAPPVTVDTGATVETDDGDIVVTGSRIRRSTYNAISPLQVITSETARDTGVFDPSQILQRDEAATGTQIDSTFQGFVLDNGPGNQTVNLRGLGADRTLLLINGRRLAPSGVGGSPTAPSINLLPSSLFQRVDLLLDGASSIYGSDAVAGVINVVLKDDFDGIELFASGNLNPNGAGDNYTVSAAWGQNFERGFFGIGAEYDFRDRVRAGDRDFLAGCTTDYELTSNGDIRTVEVTDRVNTLVASGGTIALPDNECARVGNGLRGSIQDSSFFGVLYFTPGESNSGVPDFTESGFFNGTPVDLDGNGVQDFIFADVSTNGAFPQLELIPQQERYNVMAYGEYELGGDLEITPFFEALYSRAEIESRNNNVIGNAIEVPANNAFNPCNPNQPNGVDCFNQSAIFNFGAEFLPFPIPQGVRSRIVIEGDRDNFDTTLEQYRGVFGVRGALPFIDESWTFEVSGTYTRSDGFSSALGLREDKLAFSLGIDPTADFTGDGIVDNDGDGIADDFDSSAQFRGALFGELDGGVPCDGAILANPDLAAPDLQSGCVPVNLFAPSLLGQATGQFASQAERDFLLGVREFDTTYEQILIQAFATGDLIELPAGPVGLVVGMEWREDSITSTTNFVTGNGLFYNFNADRGATGSKWIREAFGELDVPVFSNETFGDFEVNIAGRLVDEELYGTEGTYALKAGWTPTPGVLFRATYGTSFRAPNLRENFLTGTTGFQTVVDPCAVPDAAFVGGVYDPSLDLREQTVLDNCVRENRDPTTVGLDFSGQVPTANQLSGVEITRQGSLDLNPERSTSFTAGVSLEENFGDLNLGFSFSYYNIEVVDSVVELSAPFAVNDCFTREGTRSQFCDSVFVSGAPGDLGLITAADIGFLNLDRENVKGIDMNGNIGYDVLVGGETLELNLALRANHLIERSSTFIDLNDNETFTESQGRFGLPEWTGRATFTAGWDRVNFTWQTRWVGEQNQDPAGVDPLSDAFGFDPDGEFTGFFGSTCTGGGSRDANGDPDGIVAGDGVFCRDIGFTDDWFEHAASIRYNADWFTVSVGVSNIFDTAPPRVDCGEVGLCISNVPIGGTFNLNGREFFGSVSVRF